MTEDSTLLRRYADTGSEEAFAELVRLHVDLVYSVALRQVGGDTHLAQDVAQTVFTALARKAPELARREVIGGWLYRSTHFAASDAVRAERRRRAREQEALAMHESATAPEPSADVEKLRPLLDQAIGELGETDRDAICLRFFANRSYADIGARLRLSENSARMRVERALGKLHALLARRGVTSSIAALALSLPGQAATVAPAGLGATLSATALLSAGTGVGGATAGWALFTLMNTTKITLGVATLVSVAAIGTALYLRHDALAERDAARAAHAAAMARLTQLEAEVARHARTAAAAEADTATLLANVDSAAARLKAAEEPITSESVTARYKRAQALDKAGRLEEALAEYLWCYDVGMVKVPSLVGIRRTSLVSSLATLGERLPAALVALRQRQEAARQGILASASDLVAAQDFTAINRGLNEEARSLELYDSLPSGDPRRARFGTFLYDQLTTAQRYQEAAQAKPYHRVSAQFEAFAGSIPSGSTPAQTEALKVAQRQMVIRTTATSIEVFAGSGDLDHAADLALRLLDYDSSPETIALLEKHAARAGRPTMISTLRQSRP